MVPPDSDRVSRVRRYSGSCLSAFSFAYGAFTLYRLTFQNCSLRILHPCCMSSTPEVNFIGLGSSPFARRYYGNRFCFFSSAYLDVSVRQVRFLNLCIQLRILRHYSHWVSPFGYLRVKVYFQLTEAFRRLSRPSSPVDAKASTSTLNSLTNYQSYFK